MFNYSPAPPAGQDSFLNTFESAPKGPACRLDRPDTESSQSRLAAVVGRAADSLIAFTEAFDAPVPAPSRFTAGCYRKSFSRLEVLLGALSQSLPDFMGKHRNLNLLLATLRMSNELPNEAREGSAGAGAFVQSPSSATPMPAQTSSPRSGSSGATADSVKAAMKDAGKDAAKGAASKVKKGLGGLLPKKP
jgi:hypothetical protein